VSDKNPLQRWHAAAERWRKEHPTPAPQAPLSRSARRHIKILAKGARAMSAAQADLPPAIIHILHVLLDRTSFPPGHAEWVEDGVHKTLETWERTEDLAQLRCDLGLDAGKKRRRTLTMRRATAIAVSIVIAALAGAADPMKAAGDEHQADAREVQRAWKAWGPVYLAHLELMRSQLPRQKRGNIRAAIALLTPRRLRRRDKK
jgi:hypothetical protein